MNLQVNRLAYPVTTLGPGKRIALWVQGCSRRCRGCASSDTWDYSGGRSVDVLELAKEIVSIIEDNQLDGLSITGGEPFDQSDAIMKLITNVRAGVKAKYLSSLDFNVLMFTGYTYSETCEKSESMVKIIDVLVCGPYDNSLKKKNRLVATENQELVIMNKDVKGLIDAYISEDKQFLQFNINSSAVDIVGMPEVGDLELFEKKLAEKGVILGDVSWKK